MLNSLTIFVARARSVLVAAVPSLTAGRSDSEVGAGADERQGSDAGACQEPPSGIMQKQSKKTEWDIYRLAITTIDRYTQAREREHRSESCCTMMTPFLFVFFTTFVGVHSYYW